MTCTRERGEFDSSGDGDQTDRTTARVTPAWTLKMDANMLLTGQRNGMKATFNKEVDDGDLEMGASTITKYNEK